MSDFELAVKTAAERAVLDIISSGNWITPDYANRFKMPTEWLRGIWALVDTDKIRLAMAERIERELADRVMNAIATELATDIKQILSVQERREAVRAVARRHMEEIMRGAK